MGGIVRRLTLLTILAGVAAGTIFAQKQYPVAVFEPPERIPEAISFFAPFFFPKVLQDEYRLREYIRSGEFAQFRQIYGDRQAVDAIFDRALHLCWNNIYEALAVSLLATFDHRRVGVRFPLIGYVLWLPLTSEFPDEFSERVQALPTQLYADTPPEGDRDKLQHLFGSAFLAVLTESSDAAESVGEFVEQEEELLIVGGVNDVRDLRADQQGQKFGFALMADKEVRPSRFLVP